MNGDVGLRIRDATQGDAAAIAAAEWATAETAGRLVGRPGEIPVEAFAAKIAGLAGLGSYWVAERDASLVGHAFLEPMKMTGNSHVFVLNIVVHPGATGHGVGTALMDHLLRWAAGNPAVHKIELLVRATNTPAVALYRKFGFVDEGRFRQRVRTAAGDYLDDLAMAWFPERVRVSEPTSTSR